MSHHRLGDHNAPSLGKMVDLVMLTVTGGKDRTEDEHLQLLAAVGFQLNRAIPVSPEIMIVEAFPPALNASSNDRTSVEGRQHFDSP